MRKLAIDFAAKKYPLSQNYFACALDAFEAGYKEGQLSSSPDYIKSLQARIKKLEGEKTELLEMVNNPEEWIGGV